MVVAGIDSSAMLLPFSAAWDARLETAAKVARSSRSDSNDE